MEEINKFEDTNGKQAAIAIFWRPVVGKFGSSLLFRLVHFIPHWFCWRPAVIHLVC